MNRLRIRNAVTVLCTTIVWSGTRATHAQTTNAMPPLPEAGNPSRYWAAQATGDYFDFYSRIKDVNGQYTTERGDLYGGTLSVKAPFMAEDEFLDVSFHDGDLTKSGLSTRILQEQALYRYGVVNRNVEDPAVKIDLLVGLDFEQWRIGYTPPPVLRERDYLFDIGMGLNWYWATVKNTVGDRRFRIGARGEALLGVGGATLNEGGVGSGQDFVVSATGRAMIYADYKINAFSLVLQGGWAYTGYWFENTFATTFQPYYGPYVRFGFGYSFY